MRPRVGADPPTDPTEPMTSTDQLSEGDTHVPHEFECKREVVLPADPDRVWEAIATTEGVTAWQFPIPVPGAGDTGTTWDPPHHFGVRMEQGEWFNALEYVIEGRDGGTSVLRYTHSGIFMDDWDNQFDAVQQHTDFYLHTLGQYLEYFDGRPAIYIGDRHRRPPGSRALGTGGRLRPPAVPPSAWSADVAEGQEITLPVDLPGPVAGVVDYATANFLGIRTSNALYRFFGRNAFGMPVGMSIHIFDPTIDPAATRAAWERGSRHRWPDLPGSAAAIRRRRR